MGAVLKVASRWKLWILRNDDKSMPARNNSGKSSLVDAKVLLDIAMNCTKSMVVQQKIKLFNFPGIQGKCICFNFLKIDDIFAKIIMLTFSTLSFLLLNSLGAAFDVSDPFSNSCFNFRFSDCRNVFERLRFWSLIKLSNLIWTLPEQSFSWRK